VEAALILCVLRVGVGANLGRRLKEFRCCSDVVHEGEIRWEVKVPATTRLNCVVFILNLR
jgi:hypothetical protein